MKKTKTSIAKQTNSPKSLPELFIEKAIDKGLDVGAIEKLMVMRRELKAEYAQEEFNRAMAEFQFKCPVIERKVEGGKTKSGEVAYKYAPLDQIIKESKDLLKECGFSYIFKTNKDHEGKRVIVACEAKHISGHSEISVVDLPLSAGTSVMSTTQIEAATMSFAKRYAFCNAFGIITGGEDSEKTIQEESNKTLAEKEKKIQIARKLIQGRTSVARLEKDIEMIEQSNYDEMEKDYLILEAQEKIKKLK